MAFRVMIKPYLATAVCDSEFIAEIHSLCFGELLKPHDVCEKLTKEMYFAYLIGANKTIKSPGFILCRIVAEEAEIIDLAVVPECRKQGLGRSLLTSAFAEASKRGAEKIYLEVARDNQAALHLYRASGFVVVGSRSNYYRKAETMDKDAEIMCAPLFLGDTDT